MANKKKKKFYDLYVEYESEFYPGYDKIIETTLGKTAHSGSCSFGYRDMQFTYYNESVANRAKEKLEQIEGLALGKLFVEAI